MVFVLSSSWTDVSNCLQLFTELLVNLIMHPIVSKTKRWRGIQMFNSQFLLAASFSVTVNTFVTSGLEDSCIACNHAFSNSGHDFGYE